MVTLASTLDLRPGRGTAVPDSVTPTLARPFILIDDDDIFLLLHTRFLSKYLPGSQVDCYSNPSLGLDSISRLIEYVAANGQNSEEPPTVVLLDLRMPQLSGWDVLDALLQRFDPTLISNTVHIYLLSSSDDPRDRQKAAQYSIVKNYFVKPLSQELLLTHFGSDARS